MKIQINGELQDAQAYGVAYPNDLLDGVLVDMPETFMFFSDHVERHRDLQMAISDEDFEEFDMSDMEEIDYTEPPHAWVVQSVGRLIVLEAESLLD